MKKKNNYNDFVFKNGKFVGKFEEMYKKMSDPWNYENNKKKDYASNFLNYEQIYTFAEMLRLREKKKKIKILEIGCGNAEIIKELNKRKFKVYGIDISQTVIKKAKKKNLEIKKNLFIKNITDFSFFKSINPDIFIMSDVTWYVLKDLNFFLKNLKKYFKNKYLIHSLSIYGKKQKYGKNFFYDEKSILKYFNFDYIYSSTTTVNNVNKFTQFLAKIK